jgi:hypothetical protein
MEEVLENKDQVYRDFMKSGYERYTDFKKNEMKDVHLIYHLKKDNFLEKPSPKKQLNNEKVYIIELFQYKKRHCPI